MPTRCPAAAKLFPSATTISASPPVLENGCTSLLARRILIQSIWAGALDPAQTQRARGLNDNRRHHSKREPGSSIGDSADPCRRKEMRFSAHCECAAINEVTLSRVAL